MGKSPGLRDRILKESGLKICRRVEASSTISKAKILTKDYSRAILLPRALLAPKMENTSTTVNFEITNFMARAR